MTITAEERRVRDALREAIIAVGKADEPISKAQQALQAAVLEKQKLVGARDALARVFLPEGMALSQGIELNYGGLANPKEHDEQDAGNGRGDRGGTGSRAVIADGSGRSGL